MDELRAGFTAIMYEDHQLAILAGAVTLPIGARVVFDSTELDDSHVDYIVESLRVSPRGGRTYDFYYDVYRAEEVGTRPSILG